MPQFCQNPMKGVHEILSTHSFSHGMTKKPPHLNDVICNNMAKICSYKSFFQMHFISMGLNE